MAKQSIHDNRYRLGFTAVADVTQVDAIPAVAGKRISLLGGFLKVSSGTGQITMVGSDGAQYDTLLQIPITMNPGDQITFDGSEEYETPAGLGLSFLRSASMALEGELIFREV